MIFFVSRDVKYFENVFLFSNPEDVNIVPEHVVLVDKIIGTDFDDICFRKRMNWISLLKYKIHKTRLLQICPLKIHKTLHH